MAYFPGENVSPQDRPSTSLLDSLGQIYSGTSLIIKKAPLSRASIGP